ncbi:unnamed protein product [Clavelina lepadiformis]|uniref:EGF-like domain-containing protein n=1 Tax=Clavelina lepadiformis TaxID=159417 RepID=A0ABP0F059_CLALP
MLMKYVFVVAVCVETLSEDTKSGCDELVNTETMIAVMLHGQKAYVDLACFRAQEDVMLSPNVALLTVTGYQIRWERKTAEKKYRGQRRPIHQEVFWLDGEISLPRMRPLQMAIKKHENRVLETCTAAYINQRIKEGQLVFGLAPYYKFDFDRRRRRYRCNTTPCQWIWGACSRTCGGGMQSPTITRTKGACGSCNLPSPRRCNTGCCPVDCRWGSWESYGSCSRSCDGGTQYRYRSPAVSVSCGGSKCSGSSSKSRSCNTRCCPVNCAWGAWTSYGSCSTTCGTGTQTRSRSIGTLTSCGGLGCSGLSTDIRNCNTHCCPVNCIWSKWTDWNRCTRECGRGTQTRARSISTENSCGGESCNGPTNQIQPCNEHCCPVDCELSSWSPWTNCSAQCGPDGISTRTREILQTSKCGGASCPTDLIQNRPCNRECYNGGILISNQCSCSSGWLGKCCKLGEKPSCLNKILNKHLICYNLIDVDECLSGLHNCDDNAKCTNTIGTFQCSCNNGFTGNGRICSNVNECEMDVHNCHQAAICTDAEGSFSCQCLDGFIGNGRDCNDVNECNTKLHDCDENATCINTIGSFKCSCNNGFTGDGRICANINECEMEIHSCHQAATCTDVQGSFTCQCFSGHSGNGKICDDVDECLSELHNCDENALCTNTMGTFQCSCNTGFTGDGRICSNINECEAKTHNCHQAADCVDSAGSFVCRCLNGYIGNGTVCKDVNECSKELHNCDKNAKCTNTVGTFQCSCNNGFTGDGRMCLNVDECNTSTHNCHQTANCVDTEGGFTCQCWKGYTGNGTVCKDVDECNNPIHDCDDNATCKNIVGLFECSCNAGFTGDGNTCQNVNECEMENHSCHQAAMCVDTKGSFICQCLNGYSGNGTVCNDVDECSTLLQNCHEEAICINSIGSFECGCKIGFVGDGLQCANVNECNETNHECHTNATCIDHYGSYSCSCKDGYSGDGYYCQDFDECADGAHTCHLNAKCWNTEGSFTCTCVQGYFGNGTQCKKIPTTGDAVPRAGQQNFSQSALDIPKLVAYIAAGVVGVLLVVLIAVLIYKRRKGKLYNIVGHLTKPVKPVPKVEANIYENDTLAPITAEDSL